MILKKLEYEDFQDLYFIDTNTDITSAILLACHPEYQKTQDINIKVEFINEVIKELISESSLSSEEIVKQIGNSQDYLHYKEKVKFKKNIFSCYFKKGNIRMKCLDVRTNEVLSDNSKIFEYGNGEFFYESIDERYKEKAIEETNTKIRIEKVPYEISLQPINILSALENSKRRDILRGQILEVLKYVLEYNFILFKKDGNRVNLERTYIYDDEARYIILLEDGGYTAGGVKNEDGMLKTVIEHHPRNLEKNISRDYEDLDSKIADLVLS